MPTVSAEERAEADICAFELQQVILCARFFYIIDESGSYSTIGYC
jgi:hypothetical protein